MKSNTFLHLVMRLGIEELYHFNIIYGIFNLSTYIHFFNKIILLFVIINYEVNFALI